MADKIQVVICVPPGRENHIADIILYSDESPPDGLDGTSHPIGAVTVDNGRLEFEIYGHGENECRIFNCREFVDALNEGMRRLVEIYPQYK